MKRQKKRNNEIIYVQSTKIAIILTLFIIVCACTSIGNNSKLLNPDSVQNNIEEKVDTIYKNSLIGFEITLPESWNVTKYEIVEVEDGIKVFYVPQNKKIEKAILFELYKYGTEATWDEWWEGGGKTAGVPFRKIGVSRGQVIVIDGPTENIYKGQEEAVNESQEYIKMMADTHDIAESFKSLEQSGSNLEQNRSSIDYTGIREFLTSFIDNIDNRDNRNMDAFKEWIDQDGFYSITYFVDKRDINTVVHLYANEVRGDLVLANEEKMGLTLSSMFSVSHEEIQDMPIHVSEELKKISFNVDWRINDEPAIEMGLEDILKACEAMNLVDNEYIPQVFVLKDNMYAFAISSVNLETVTEITGEWLVFEKQHDKFKIRAVMEFQ
ncbi:hypothetical protein [Fontibacillus sp. BL9]|uniref:hypothetical protein n=1 Tax=Fontibacillus sp. BL9 TaxID=3389971 RepID=UPI00397A08EA